MLWICKSDGVAYSVGASHCPQCGCTDYVEQGSEEHEAMAKIAKQGGPSDATAYPPADLEEDTSGAYEAARQRHAAGHASAADHEFLLTHRPPVEDDAAGRRAAYEAAQERDARGEATPADGELLRSYGADDVPFGERVDEGDGVEKVGTEHVLVGEHGPELTDLAPGAMVTPKADEPDYDSKDVDWPRAECAARDLATGGTPKQLAARLRKDDEKNARPADAEGVDGTERS